MSNEQEHNVDQVMYAQVKAEMDADASTANLTAEEYRDEFDKRVDEKLKHAENTSGDLSNVPTNVLGQMCSLIDIMRHQHVIYSTVAEYLGCIQYGEPYISVWWLVVGSAYQHAAKELQTMVESLTLQYPELNKVSGDNLVAEFDKRQRAEEEEITKQEEEN